MDNKLNITAIVQARTTSSRFPRKVLQKINGKTIMQIIHSRLKKSNFIDKIVFAIPKNTSIGLISLVIYLAIFASIGTIVCLNFASSRLPGTNVMAYSLLIPFWVLMVESTTKDSLAPSYTYIGIIPIGLGLLMLYRNS